jgi:hypothetical protein
MIFLLLREGRCFARFLRGAMKAPSGAKARVDFTDFAARLKPCPFKTMVSGQVFMCFRSPFGEFGNQADKTVASSFSAIELEARS